uniref:T cell activation inhibitor, mitochondrial n=1 Tax=Eptatretus burgeri TaxID=7764 RepID=A0A8C4QU34_EPTBU
CFFPLPRVGCLIGNWRHARQARYISSAEVTTALRAFYLAVHPDRFGQHPQERAVNENSLKRLNGYLENLQKGGSVQPLQVTFYVREDRPACPTNVPLTRPSHGTPRASKARAFQAVSFTLLSQEPLAAVRNILHSCQLPTEHLSSLRPSTSPWSLSHDPQISRPDRPIIWDPSYYVFTGRASPRRKAQSSQVDLSLRSWLRKRAEDAHAKLEGSLPLREQLHHLTKDLCLELKLTDIRWQRQWGLAYRNSHLHSLARLVEQYPEPVQCLRGKTVLFTDHSGVNAHGDAMLGIMDVHHHWIKEIPMILRALLSTASRRALYESGAPAHRGEKYSIKLRMKALQVMEERGCCKLALTQLQQAEGRLALQLGGLQLTVLEPDCHVVPLGEHFRRIQVLQRRVLSGRLLFHPGSLQNLLMILGGADSKLQLLDEGVFEVPALCQVTSLQQFLLKNAGKAQRRLLEQHRLREEARRLQTVCVHQLGLWKIDTEVGLPLDRLVDCYRRLLSADLNLRGLYLRLSRIYTVSPDGEMSIPWNWKL